MDEVTVDIDPEGLEGEMELPNEAPSSKQSMMSTLDEPVSTTIVCSRLVLIKKSV